MPNRSAAAGLARFESWKSSKKGIQGILTFKADALPFGPLYLTHLVIALLGSGS